MCFSPLGNVQFPHVIKAHLHVHQFQKPQALAQWVEPFSQDMLRIRRPHFMNSNVVESKGDPP